MPDLEAGWIRLAILLDDPATEPGAIARAAGTAVEQLGPLAIDGGQALVDVRAESLEELRAALETLGPVQVHSRPSDRGGDWTWLRLSIGRNHSLTPATLRRTCARAGCPTIGTFLIRNTCAFVGVPAIDAPAILAALDGKRVNGYPLRARLAEDGERPRQSPVYSGKR
jgi:hypothetical protein